MEEHWPPAVPILDHEPLVIQRDVRAENLLNYVKQCRVAMNSRQLGRGHLIHRNRIEPVDPASFGQLRIVEITPGALPRSDDVVGNGGTHHVHSSTAKYLGGKFI